MVRTLAAVGAVAAVLAAAATAHAAVPAGNLLQNGDAESGAGATDDSTTAPVPVPGWTTTAHYSEHAYVPGGSFPDSSVSASIGGGSQFFTGGPSGGGDNVNESATQDVDVSGAAAEIDAGGVSAALAAAIGGYATQEDNAMVTATFLGTAGQDLGHVTIGPVTRADRGDATTLLPRSATATMPAGTRKIRVVVAATKLEGDYNDGYVDNVSLTLAGPGAQPQPHPQVTGPKGNPLGLPTVHGCVDTRKFSFRLHHAPKAKIVTVDVFINGRKKLTRHGANITRLTLKRLPKKKFVVRIVATQDTGSQLVSRRTYKGCKKSRARTRAHHHRHG